MPTFFLALQLALYGCTDPDPTVNGDTQWQTIALATHARFADLVFVDDHHGWLAGGAYNAPGGILGSTEDGGLSWSFASGIADKEAKGLSAVHFFNKQLGLVGTDRGEILKTTDGGRSWRTTLKLPNRFGNRASGFEFPSYGVGYTTIGNRLVRTDDFGDTWYCLTAPSGRCPPAPQCQNIKVGNVAVENLDFSALAFRSPSHITAISGRYFLATSNDGGCSWQRNLTFNSESGTRLHAVRFANAKQGWVVGDRGLVATTQDGGKSWAQTNDSPSFNFRDLVFLDAQNGYLIGEQNNRSGSVLLSTVNGGLTWQTEFELSNDLLQSLHANLNGKLWSAGTVLDITQGQRLLRSVHSR